jgi:two-component system LytT family response regulator
MPGKNGMAIYNYFTEPDFKIIFVTAYQQYAISALNHSAAGYLLKPVSFVDLQELLQKVSKDLSQKQQQRELEDRLNILSSAEMTGKNIVLDVENGFIMENTKNIEYCYANQSYSVVVLHTKKEIFVTKPLKSLQELLPQNQFYRTHKSYLVNVFYIRKYFRGNESYVILKSGVKIPVSVRTSAIISNDIKKMLLL